VWDLIFTRNDTPTPELNWPKKEQWALPCSRL
jgi:tRNA (guanine-N7-)-methyltransferase